MQNDTGFGGSDVAFLEEDSSMDLEQSNNMFYETHQSIFLDRASITNDIANVPQHFDSFLPFLSWPWTHQGIFFQEGFGPYNSDPNQFADQLNLAPVNGLSNTEVVQTQGPSSGYQASVDDPLTVQGSTDLDIGHQSNRGKC